MICIVSLCIIRGDDVHRECGACGENEKHLEILTVRSRLKDIFICLLYLISTILSADLWGCRMEFRDD
jgi:hypothetical protein